VRTLSPPRFLGAGPLSDVKQPPVCGLVDAVLRDLERADRLDSFAGQLALQLARKMADHEATGVASLSKELRTVLAAAVAKDDGPDPSSPAADSGVDAVDEAGRKRDEKRAAAGQASP
ncbi:MAG: hypothetical protein ACREXY_04190, partial [Gammaproteobacteria bacterium]